MLPSWQLAQPSSRYTCRPRAIGSVAAGSGAQAATRRTTARLQRHRSRPIMRRVPENASLNDVTVVLDDRAILRGISLRLGPGLTLVRGPNGAGKTTLLRALAGLAPLSRGRRSVSGGPPLYIGHRPMLLGGLTARENLAFLAAFRGLVRAAVAATLPRWGLADDMHRPVERLSPVRRRRASLARIETEQMPLVLLHEPFAD